MQFTYNGFHQEGDQRCYKFDTHTEKMSLGEYAIWVDLALFRKHQVALQNGPSFCLQILQTGCGADRNQMERFANYHATDADFAGLLSERAERAAALASRRQPRRSFRKPQPTSQLGRHIT